MSAAIHPQLVTKQQLLNILAAWEQEPTLPTAREQCVIVWPSSADTECECARITKTARTSDYGQRLYAIEMGSVAELFPQPVTIQ